ncbi:hypothetical protein IGI04_002481, partial [Brassica rapa subsp. trilocularis]
SGRPSLIGFESSRPPWYALVKVQIPVKKLPGKRRGDDAHREREEHSGGCDGNHFLAGAAERFQINLEQYLGSIEKRFRFQKGDLRNFKESKDLDRGTMDLDYHYDGFISQHRVDN